MGDTVNNDEAQKKSFFKGLKAEYNKIIWPDSTTVCKQTIAVVSAAVALGAIIGVLDLILKFGIELLLTRL